MRSSLTKDKLTILRKEIDHIDNSILKLIAKRFSTVKQIGEFKGKHNLPPFDNKRWKEVLKSRIGIAKSLNLNIDLIKNIYEFIHIYSIRSQEHHKTKIYGIQGGISSFNEEALTNYLEKNKINKYKIKYLYISEKVLRNLNVGNIDYGLFAITNSTGGIVNESMKSLAKYPVTIISDFDIPIQHFLMKRKDINMKGITTIMAHPQVFAQCRKTLEARFSKYKLVSGEGDLVDTAKAAKYLSENKLPESTAILGPIGLVKKYNFDIIAENLQDRKDNRTRFLLVKRG